MEEWKARLYEHLKLLPSSVIEEQVQKAVWNFFKVREQQTKLAKYGERDPTKHTIESPRETMIQEPYEEENP